MEGHAALHKILERGVIPSSRKNRFRVAEGNESLNRFSPRGFWILQFRDNRVSMSAGDEAVECLIAEFAVEFGL